jgi:hypothetical protein
MALLSDLPVDVTVNRRLPQDESDRVLEIAAEAKKWLEAEGWFGLLLPAAKRGEERERTEARVAHVTELLHRLSASGLITSVTAVSPIEPLLAKTLQLTSFRVLVGDEKGGPTVEVVLLSRLPVAEAVRLARVEHPTLRLAPSSGTVVGDCFDRYGVVPGWSDLAAMMPEEVPDEAAAEAVRKDPKEQEELERLKAQSWSVPYSVAGRRGSKPTALCDLTRVLDLAGLLEAFLGAEVTIDKPATLRATRARVTQVIHYSRVPGDPPGPVTEHLPPEQQYDIDLPVEGLRISPEALAAYFAWKGAQAGSACAA